MGGTSALSEDLLAAALTLSAEHDFGPLLSRAVAEARRVFRLRYAALAVHWDDGGSWRFVQNGPDTEATLAVSPCPVADELLVEVADAASVVRVDDMAIDPRTVAFPVGHPPMRRLLGVSIATVRNRYGSLLLCDRLDGSDFDESDEVAVAVFAKLAASAIESARLIDAERDNVEARAQAAAAEAREVAQRELLGQVIAAQEAERARVSRDLHDEIGQALTSVLLGLHLVEDPPGEEPEPDGARTTRLVEVRGLVADALEQVRSLAFELRPTVLDDIGIVPALHRLADDTAERSDLQVDVTIHGLDDPVRLPGEVETVIYRAVQESLTNVVRHAAATLASVFVVADPVHVRAVIEDDGQGFDPGSSEASLGLAGMRERAALAEGSLLIESSPGQGTTIIVEIPLD